MPLVRVHGQPSEALVGRTDQWGPSCLRGPPWFPKAMRGRSTPSRRYWRWAEGRVRAPARLAGEAQRPSSSRSVTSRPTCVTKAVNGPTDWAQDQWGGSGPVGRVMKATLKASD